ncbi:MAG TPA: hypothetical protein VKH20_03695 [Solirubrobacterales bacterium]|nr:hypothetical protein [Solirubrobacterales bacterium]
MPRLVPFRLVAACVLALLLLLPSAALAAGKGTKVSVRVVGSGGKALADEFVNAKTTSIKTSSKATCLGGGTGGSGKSVQVKGPNALGALSQASKLTPSLRPLLVTDHFLSEFGLGLCGIGKSKTTKKLSWYLKVNHKNPNKGGEKVMLHKGDEVLWALEPFPYPDELSLLAPHEAEPNKPFTVSVFSYDDKGKKTPAAGAMVTGATAPTGADGTTQVTFSAPGVLTATEGKDIPSNQVAVCLNGACSGG